MTYTDADIAKALKCCADKKRCYACSFCVTSREPCYITLAREAASLLARREAEIESLKIAIEVTRDNLGDARAELQKAESKIERLKGMVSQNEGVLPQYEALVRADAIKKFAERLKRKSRRISEYDEGGWYMDIRAVKVEDIDNLVKEMTEDKS